MMRTTFIDIGRRPPGATSVLLFFDLTRTQVFRQRVFSTKRSAASGEAGEDPGQHAWQDPADQDVVAVDGDLAYEVTIPALDPQFGPDLEHGTSTIVAVEFAGALPRLHPETGHVWMVGDVSVDGRSRSDLMRSHAIGFPELIRLRRRVARVLADRVVTGGSDGVETGRIAAAMSFFADMDERTNALSDSSDAKTKVAVEKVHRYLADRLRKRAIRARGGLRSVQLAGYSGDACHVQVVAGILSDALGTYRDELTQHFALFVAGELSPVLYESVVLESCELDVSRPPAYLNRIHNAARPDSAAFLCFAEACFWLCEARPHEREFWLSHASTMVWAADAFVGIYWNGRLRLPVAYTSGVVPLTVEVESRRARLKVIRTAADRFRNKFVGRDDSGAAAVDGLAIEDAFTSIVAHAFRDVKKENDAMDLTTVYSREDGNGQLEHPVLIDQGHGFPDCAALPDGLEPAMRALHALCNDPKIRDIGEIGTDANAEVERLICEVLDDAYGAWQLDKANVKFSGTDGGWRPDIAGVHVPVSNGVDDGFVHWIGLSKVV